MTILNINYYFIILFFFTNIFLFKFTSYFFLKYGIVDKPDKKLKFHKKIVAYNGGTVFFLNFIVIFFYSYCSDLIPFDVNIALLLSVCLIIFFIGFIDDVLNISPILRFSILVLILFIFIKSFDSFNLEILKFNDLDFVFYIYSAGILFTIFSLLSFIQASNMIDGINLQIGIYNIALIIYLNSFVMNFSIYLIPVLLVFLFFNFKDQSFFGDGGSYFSSFLIGSLFIYFYNTTNTIFSDDIFITMLVPGLDMIRLFFSRINNKKSPFAGDRNHLHHLLFKKYNEAKAMIYSPLIVIHPMIFKIFINNNIMIILLCLIIYSSIIIFLKSK